MTYFFNKLKKFDFWPVFPISEAKKIFKKNPALLRTSPYEPLSTFIGPFQPQSGGGGLVKDQKIAAVLTNLTIFCSAVFAHF